jgi:nucleolar protein 14
MSSKKPKKLKKTKKPQEEQKINPFEIRKMRQKHDVLNRKVLGGEQRPWQSMAAAQQKRNATLGIDYDQRWKRNKFLDRRFGENNANLSPEDKMLLRFQKTRQKLLSRQSIYNLDEEELTHMGQSLSVLDEFRDEQNFDDDDEENDGGKIENEIVRDLHFGGFQLVPKDSSRTEQTEMNKLPQPPKTKKEIMEEVIAKSKYYKAQRAKEREERLDLTEQLDQEFKNIRDLLSFSHSKNSKKVTKNDKEQSTLRTEESDENEKQSSHLSNSAQHAESKNENENREFNQNVSLISSSTSKEIDDDYNQLLQKLRFEPRAQPSNPLLTPEQLAKAEHERLQQLEAARLRRMNAENDEISDSDDNENKERENTENEHKNADNNIVEENTSKQTHTSKKISADDLGDEDYMNIISPQSDEDEDEDHGSSGSHKEVVTDDSEVDEENEENEMSDDEGDDDIEDVQSDDRNDIIQTESEMSTSPKDRTGHGNDESVVSSRTETKEATESAMSIPLLPSVSLTELLQLNPHKYKEVKDLKPDDELPYTLAMPTTFEQFNALLNGQSPTRQSTLIKRLQACYHPSLSPHNNDIIKYFYWFLMKRFLWLGKQTPTVDMDSVNVLIPPLFELSQQIPDFAGHLSRYYLVKIESSLCQNLENLSEMQHKPWISLNKLFLFKLFSYIWPVSDRRHVVATPAMILMGQLLTHTMVLNHYHLLTNLLLTNTFIHWLTPAKRFAPEPFNFLFGVLRAFVLANANTFQNSKTSALPIYAPLVTVPSQLLQLSTISSPSSRTATSTDHTPQQAEDKFKVLPLDISLLSENKIDNPIFQTDEFKISLLYATIKSLEELIQLYVNNEACVELLKSAVILLRDIPLNSVPLSVQEYIQKLSSDIEKRIRSLEMSRQPLQLHKKKPQPLPLLTPDFKGTEYVPSKYKSKDKSERERKMLLRKYKQELKGAERELRKDSIFLAQKRMQKYLEQKEEKEKKQKEIWQWLESLQHEFNVEKKSKKRKTSDL